MLKIFDHVCERLGVPIAKEQTEGPMTKMEQLGLTLDTNEMCVHIPDNKVQELLKQIDLIAFSKKVTLKQLSRAQFQKFKELAPHADSSPTMVPYEFLIFLNDNIKV